MQHLCFYFHQEPLGVAMYLLTMSPFNALVTSVGSKTVYLKVIRIEHM